MKGLLQQGDSGKDGDYFYCKVRSSNCEIYKCSGPKKRFYFREKRTRKSQVENEMRQCRGCDGAVDQRMCFFVCFVLFFFHLFLLVGG